MNEPCGPSSRPGHTPSYPRWKGLLRQSQTCLSVLLTEMETYYEQRSEPWQESERGTAFLQRLENLQEAREAMEALDW